MMIFIFKDIYENFANVVKEHKDEGIDDFDK